VLCFNLKIRFRLDPINTVNFATRRESCAISSSFYNRICSPLTAQKFDLRVREGYLEILGHIVVERTSLSAHVSY
jgi:folate-dependent phosphoribosylglycinamide formyltransferase PurN